MAAKYAASSLIPLILLFVVAGFVNTKVVLNDRPIIGVLSQEYHGKLVRNSSMIAASYVKYLESAGARVVPILLNRSISYYETIFNYTNGVLFPGGSQYFEDPTNEYGRVGKILYDMATKANDAGDFYPIWATCLGYELLTYLASGNKLRRFECNIHDVPLPLDVTQGSESSRILTNMPADVKTYLTTLPVTINYHIWCYSPQNFTNAGLDNYFRIVSTNQDPATDLTFISTIEGISYPFYGVQWHPEKNNFEFTDIKDYRLAPHFYEAVRVSQHFANFFVNEARKSTHRFPDKETEVKSLIYNYTPTFTLRGTNKFAQEYFFSMFP